jgi:hypothetical protein
MSLCGTREKVLIHFELEYSFLFGSIFYLEATPPAETDSGFSSNPLSIK